MYLTLRVGLGEELGVTPLSCEWIHWWRTKEKCRINVVPVFLNLRCVLALNWLLVAWFASLLCVEMVSVVLQLLLPCSRHAHLWCVVMPLTDWRNWDQTGSAGNKKKTNARLHSAQLGMLSRRLHYLLCLLQSFFHRQIKYHIWETKGGQKTNCAVPQPLQTPSECHFHILLLCLTWTAVNNIYTDF